MRDKAASLNLAYQLKLAINAYLTEYGRYPVSGNPTEGTWVESGPALMDIIQGTEITEESRELNPRRIAFFTGKKAKRRWGGGIIPGLKLTRGGTYELLDSWRNHYRIILDLNEDRRIRNIDPKIDADQLPESILVWSAGPDGDFDTWEDNVKTW